MVLEPTLEHGGGTT